MKTGIKSLILSGAAVLLTTAVQAQEHVFKLHHFLGPQAPAHSQMLEPWARQVEENAGGSVKIELYPSMTLGGRPPELIQQARDGVVDIVWTVNGYTPGLFPRTEVMELPGVFLNDAVAANLAMYDMFDEHLAEEYQGVEVMWLHVHAGQGIMSTGEPIRSTEDAAGKQIRIPTRTGAWVIEALGASPVAMPVPEVPAALSKKTVEAVLLPWEIIPPLKLQNQIDYFIEGTDATRLGTTTFQVSMNQARWDSLPQDVQKAFRDASGRDWWGEVGRIWRGADDFGINMAVEAGKEHIVLSQEETDAMMAALEPVRQRWIDEVGTKNIDGAALIEAAQTAIANASE